MCGFRARLRHPRGNRHRYRRPPERCPCPLFRAGRRGRRRPCRPSAATFPDRRPRRHRRGHRRPSRRPAATFRARRLRGRRSARGVDMNELTSRFPPTLRETGEAGPPPEPPQSRPRNPEPFPSSNCPTFFPGRFLAFRTPLTGRRELGVAIHQQWSLESDESCPHRTRGPRCQYAAPRHTHGCEAGSPAWRRLRSRRDTGVRNRSRWRVSFRTKGTPNGCRHAARYPGRYLNTRPKRDATRYPARPAHAQRLPATAPCRRDVQYP